MLQKVFQQGVVMGSVADVEYKKKVEKERKDRLMFKPLHGRFFKETKEDASGEAIAGPRSWEWVRSGYCCI